MRSFQGRITTTTFVPKDLSATGWETDIAATGSNGQVVFFNYFFLLLFPGISRMNRLRCKRDSDNEEIKNMQ